MNQQIQQSIYDAIDVVVNKRNSELRFDRTINCVIEEVKNLITGEYKVRYLDEAFSAYAPGTNYRVGRMVQVLIPQGDMSQRKTILNLIDNEEELETEVVLNEERYAPVGLPIEEIYKNLYDINNAVNGSIKEYGIYGSYDGVSLNIFNNNNSNDSEIDYDAVFQQYAKDQTMFMVTVEFKTRWLYETVISGNYNLTLTFENTEGSLIDYSISSKNLLGNPYKYINYTRANFVFPIDGNKLKRLKSITLNSKYFKRQDVNKVEIDNAIAENALKQLWNNGQGMSEIFVRNISMSFVQKTQLSGYSLQVTYPNGQYGNLTKNLQLRAEVRYDGGLVNNTSSFQYYWFKRNIQVSLGHELYNELGGIGWELIENENNKTYSNILLASNEVSREFKAVVICNGVRLSSTGILYRQFSKDTYGQLILSQHGDGTGTIEAVLNNLTQTDLQYYWIEENNIGVVTNLGFQSTGNKLNIITSNILDYRIYRCQILKNNKEIITLKIVVYNNKEDKEYDVIFNVSQGGVYTYDTKGDLYLAQIYEKPITSHSIDFNIPQDIGPYSYQWIFPQNSLILSTNGNLKSNNKVNGGKFSIEFEIDNRYDASKAANNQIELRITTDKQAKSFYYNLSFIKEGDPGTNGTSLTMKIDYAENSPKTLVPGGSIKLIVDLWYNGSPEYMGRSVNSYFNINSNAFIANDYKIKNPLKDGAYISFTGNQITITAKSSFDSYLEDENGYNFNSIIQIKMEPNDSTFNYNINGLYGIPVSNNSTWGNISINGTKTIVYQSDGYNPSYSSIPATILIPSNITKPNDLSITIASESTGGNFKEQYENGEKIITNIFEPVEYYNNKNTYAAYEFKENDYFLFMPIVFLANAFSKEVLNHWDGSSVQIDAEGGTILAPQIGAGLKDNNNTFTGVLMGQYIGADDSGVSGSHGLYGFQKGNISFGFLADGTAFIGKSGEGRILFDGNKSTITSSNFTDNSGMQIDLDTGLIDAYNFQLKSKSLIIDSTDSSFKFDISQDLNGKFKIKGRNKTLINISNDETFYLQSDNYENNAAGMRINLEDGSISAKDFKIDSYGNATFSGRLEAASGTFEGKITGGSISIGEYFHVSNAGVLTASEVDISGKINATNGKIGGWNINNEQIYSDSGDTILNADGHIITSNLTMNGGSINWSSINETESGAYGKAEDAENTANNAQNAANQAMSISEQIANGTYYGGTFIDGQTIYSPNIYTDNFTIFARDGQGNIINSGIFSLNAGGSDIFSIEVENYGSSGRYANITSAGTIKWNAITDFSTTTTFSGYVGFTGTSVYFTNDVVDFTGVTTIRGIAATFG